MEAIKLPFGWKTAILSDTVRQDGYGLVDGPFGSNLPASDYVVFGIPVIRGSNISLGAFRFRDEQFVYVSKETAKRLERSLCRPGDIIYTKKGTLGQVGIIPIKARFSSYLISSNQMKLSVNEQIANSLYVYYFFSSAITREKIIRDSEVTGVPKTNLAYLRKFPIVLPPLPEQQAIAHILGSLDDKIELNLQMNETLEGIARALFKSWFVDFDPVRAKMEGRQPFGMDEETAGLFPDGFEDSRLGEVPKGWEITKLGNIIELAYGKALKEENRLTGSIPVYGSNGQVGWHNEALVKGPGIVIGRKGNPGTVTLSEDTFFPIDTTFYVVSKGKDNPIYYLFHAIKALNLKSLDTDSAVPGLNRNIAYMTHLVSPHSNVSSKFNNFVTSFYHKIKANENENQTLSTLRDTLLPKLLSGELRIKQAEKEVEAIL